jgi:hypothetical protein
MFQENVEAIHRGVDATNRGEPDAILDLIDDGVVWEPLRTAFEGASRDSTSRTAPASPD